MTNYSLFNNLSTIMDKTLKNLVMSIRKRRKWYTLSPTCRAFIKAYLMTRLKKIRNHTLAKAVINAVKEIKQTLSNQTQLILRVLKEAWKISQIVSLWGHPKARQWKNDKSFIIYCGSICLLTKMSPCLTV
ncbi:MAG: hypothetical protein QW240_04880 [Candidatus Caldarchaeum sp.]